MLFFSADKPEMIISEFMENGSLFQFLKVSYQSRATECENNSLGDMTFLGGRVSQRQHIVRTDVPLIARFPVIPVIFLYSRLVGVTLTFQYINFMLLRGIYVTLVYVLLNRSLQI